MKVQISEVTQRLLDQNEWDIRERGTIRLKGKGLMKTYWLNYRKTKNQAGGTTGAGQAVDQTRSNGNTTMTIATICRQDTEPALGMVEGARPGLGALISQTSIHDSNYSLFVRDRIKRSCLII